MKTILFMCLFFSNGIICMGNDKHDRTNKLDDEFELIRDARPDLYCYRVLEKIENVFDKMNEEINHFHDPAAYQQAMLQYEARLERLYKKLYHDKKSSPSL